MLFVFWTVYMIPPESSSPAVPEPPAKPSSSSAERNFRAFLIQLFRRVKNFFDAQALPYVANKTCEVYLGDSHKSHQVKCRRILRSRLELNPTQLQHFFQTSVGDMLVGWFEHFFHLPDHHDNHPDKRHALKEMLIQMAADPEGLSLLSFLRRFPDTIQFNTDQLLFTAKRVELMLQETDRTIAVVRELAAQEQQATPAVRFAELPDLRQRGDFTVKRFRFVLDGAQRHQVDDGDELRSLPITCYEPQPWPEKMPVIVQSHGLASSPDDMELYGRHMASHGYFVVAPQHSGSDIQYVRQMLQGETAELFKWTEFINRPLDIQDALDELERRNAEIYDDRLQLEAVGIMGYSFGAYTAFALAGAEIHFETLESACGATICDPNISLLLQCQALGLPRQRYHLLDSRIQAILSLDSVGSEVFGPMGMANVQIPAMLVAGSHDPAAPLAFEQIRMFHWLQNTDAYLALMQGKSHLRDARRLVRLLDLQINVSPSPSQNRGAADVPLPFESYVKALSIAFFGVHIKQESAIAPYLSSSYADYLSQSPYDFWLISQASKPQLDHQLEQLDLNLVSELIDPTLDASSNRTPAPPAPSSPTPSSTPDSSTTNTTTENPA